MEHSVCRSYSVPHQSLLGTQCRLHSVDGMFVTLQCNLRKHISRMHTDLTADQQQELLTLGKLSNAELAQKEASSVFTSNVKHRWQAAHNSRPRTWRQKAPLVNNYTPSNSSHEEQMQDYFREEPVRIFRFPFSLFIALQRVLC